MKLKKVLSLALAIGSLATSSAVLTSKAIKQNAENSNQNQCVIGARRTTLMPTQINMETIRQVAFNQIALRTINDNELDKRLYHQIMKKNLAPSRKGGIIEANKRYILRMVNNITEYDDEVARFYNIDNNQIDDIYRDEFITVCNRVVRSLSHF